MLTHRPSLLREVLTDAAALVSLALFLASIFVSCAIINSLDIVVW